MAESLGDAVLRLVVDAAPLRRELAGARTFTLAQVRTIGLQSKAAMTAALAGAAVAVGVGLTKVGDEFDAAYDQIAAKTGATGKRLEGLKDDFRVVFADVPSSADEVATAIGEVNRRLDLVGGPLQVRAKQFLTLSRVTGTDLAANISSVSRAFQDWEVPVMRQGRALDGFLALSQKTGIGVSDLASQVVQFGAPLRNFGFSLEQSAAMFAGFEEAGVNMGTTMSGLRLGVGNLADPTAELAQRLKGLGLATAEPREQFLGIISAMGRAKTEQEALGIAIDVFGRRAANDMKEAVKQGRFEVEDLMRTFHDGKGTIKDTADETDDWTEKLKTLRNKGMLAIEGPATAMIELLTLLAAGASVAFDAFGSLPGPIKAAAVAFALLAVAMRANPWVALGLAVLAVVGIVKTNWPQIRKAIEPVLDWLKGAVHAVGSRLGGLGQAAKSVAGIVADAFSRVIGPVIEKAVPAIKQAIGGIIDIFGGVIRFVKGVFTLDFREAWGGIKDIFAGAARAILGIVKALTAPLRAVAGAIGKGLASIFGGAWEKVKDIFGAARDALIAIVNWIISNVINRIPGVELGPIGGGGGESGGRGHRPSSHSLADEPGHGRLAVGGRITRPTVIVGEEAPRHPEFVLATNPAYRPRNLALWQQAGREMGVRGLAGGGLVSGIGGAISDAISGGGSPVANQTGELIARLDDAPWGRLPGFLADTAGWIKDHAADWIKKRVSSLVEAASSAITGGMTAHIGGPTGVGSYMGLPMANWVIESLLYAAHRGVQPQPTSGYRSHAENVAAGRDYYSEHEGTRYPHGAVDFGGYSSGLAAKMSVVRATSDFKWPLLAPIGFHDEGHASGTGHVMGGIVGELAGHPVVRMLAEGGLAEGGVIGRPLPADLQRYNRLYARHVSPDYGGEQMPPDKIAELAEFFAMPGIAMAQIARGESDYRPGAVGDDRAAGYGDTFGYGLWQITTGASGMDSVVARMGGYPTLLNPVANAIVAAKMYAARGVAPWLGTRYLTDSGAHWGGSFGERVRAGGQARDGAGGRGGDKGGRGASAGGLLELEIESTIPDHLAPLPKDEIPRVAALLGRDPARGKKAMADLIERIKGVGLADSAGEKLDGFGAAAEIASEMASRASDLGEAVGGKSESEWLGEELAQRFGLRNALVRAQEQLRGKVAKLKALQEAARHVLASLRRAVEEAEARRKRLEAKLEEGQGQLRTELGRPANRQDRHKIGQLKDRIREIAEKLGIEMWRSQAAKRGQGGLAETILPALKERMGDLGDQRSALLGDLVTVQGIGGPMEVLAELPAIGTLGGDIFAVQMQLRELGEQASVTDASAGGGGGEDTEAGLHIQELIDFAAAVRYGAFDRETIGALPAFHGGGVVGGPTGTQEVIARLLPEEGVVDARTMRDGIGAPQTLFADLYIGGEKIDERVEGKIREADRAGHERYRAGRR